MIQIEENSLIMLFSGLIPLFIGVILLFSTAKYLFQFGTDSAVLLGLFLSLVAIATGAIMIATGVGFLVIV